MPDYTLDWGSGVSANGTTTLTGATGPVNVTIATNINTAGQTASVGNMGTPSAPALFVSGITEPITTTMTFDRPVENINFEIYDIDFSAGSWDDSLQIIALDANGNQIPISYSDLDGLHSIAGDTVNADGSFNGGVETIGAEDSVTVSIPGPIASLQFIFDNGESWDNSGQFGIGNMSIDAAAPDYVVEGGNGDDTIDAFFNGDPEGDQIDSNDALDGSNDDLVYGGSGNDTIQAGAGNDTIYGDAIFIDPADYPSGTEGAASSFTFVNNSPIEVQLYWIDTAGVAQPYDVVPAGGSVVRSSFSDHNWLIQDPETGQFLELIGNPADGSTYTFDSNGADSVSGGAGDDTVYLEGGDDTFGDWSTEAGNDTVFGGAGDDSINGGAGNDSLYGGSGADTLTGAYGNDYLDGGTGNDQFWITDDHENDTIVGGEDVGGGDWDSIWFSDFLTSAGVTVTANGIESGTYSFNGTAAAGSFSQIEAIGGTENADTFDMTADTGGTTIYAGEGADTITTGTGDDSIYLGAGSPDGDGDVIILEDGFGADTVYEFDAPTPNGDGTFTGIDTLDVTGLVDLGGDPILTNDVTVGNDGLGNAVLSFPNGETLTLVGISPTDANDPFFLNAIGIPMPDGTVEGTSGADTIGTSYTGDPDGDMVDAGDAILPGDTGNDDLIYGYGGNDNIYSGLGNDEVYGGSGDDLIQDSSGNSTLYGGADNDTINSGSGNDTVFGGTGDDRVNASIGADDVYGGDGNDTLSAGGFAGTGDLLDGGADNDTIIGGLGNDTLVGGTGDDSIVTASTGGTDFIQGGADVGNGDVDTLTFTDSNGPDGVDVTMSGNEFGTYDFAGESGQGAFSEIEEFTLTDQNDTFDGSAAISGTTVDGGAGDDEMSGSEGADSFDGGAGNDTLTGLGGEDTIEGGTGDDVIAGDATNPTATASAGDAGQLYLDLANVEPGSETGTPGDAQVGDSVIFNNAATLPDGTIVSVKVTVVGTTDPGVTINLTDSQSGAPLRVNGNGDAANAGEEVEFQMEFFDQATGLPIVISGDATVTDIDDNAGAGQEYVSFSDADINSYTVANPTEIVTTSSGGTVTGTGTTTNNAADEDAWFGVGFNPTDALTFKVGVVQDTANYGFSGSDITGGVTTTVDGGANDSLSGGAGNDTIFGNGGDDIIDGGADDDDLFGGAGQDTLTGGDGNDTLYGGDIGEVGNLIVNGSFEDLTGVTDTSYGGVGTGSITGWTDYNGGDLDLHDNGKGGTFATDGDYVLDMGGTPDNIHVYQDITGAVTGEVYNLTLDAGDVTGGGNSIEIYWGGELIATIDPVEGGMESFSFDLIGGAGDGANRLEFKEIGPVDVDGVQLDNVQLIGVDGTAVTQDTSGDNLSGGAGSDTLYGLEGNDTLNAGDDSDTAYGGAGNDTINAGSGDDTLYGGTGSDTLTGGDGADNITGGADADVIYGGPGDVVDGSEDGVDNDTLYVSGATNIIYDTGNPENGVVQFATGPDLVFTNIENVVMLNDGTVSGTAGDDLINSSYTGDPDGDQIDSGDALISGHNPNDDFIEAGAGNDDIDASLGSDTVYAGTGDDLIYAGADGSADTVFGEAGNDTMFGFDGDDELYGGADNDIVDGDAGNDSLYGGTGDDELIGDAGEDLMFGGDGADTFYAGTENDTIYGGDGDDLAYGGDGDDTMELWLGNDTAYGGEGADYIDGAQGADELHGGGGNDTILAGSDDADDTLFGGSGNDSLSAGEGEDTLYGGTGDDTQFGAGGDDVFVLEDTFGNDTITGGETDETIGDTLDASDVTADLTLDLSTLQPGNPEMGTLSDGASTATFEEIETVILGTGDDSVIGSSGDDMVATNAGADTINLGAGNDMLDLGLDGGGSDGDADVIILQDGSGDDTIMNFDAPTPNGDGTFTGIDTFDVTNLTDGTDPVNTNDVTVGNDGSGNAVLSFPNGESVTLIGISPTDADNPFYLNAIGIPLPDGTVSGTAGNDTINASYTGDPDGDMVDAGDAILAGDTGDDDFIEAGAGADTITSGLGNDEVYAGTGNDTVFAGSGDDIVFGEDGNDLIFAFQGDDTIYGGTGNDIINGGADNDTLFGGDDRDTFVQETNVGTDAIFGGEGGDDNDLIRVTPADDVTITTNGDESGTITSVNTTTAFEGIEGISTGAGNDTVNLSGDSAGMTITTNDGTDSILGGSGDDVINSGNDADTVSGGVGSDTVNAGAGDDTITFAEGDDVDGGSGDDLFVLEDLGEPTNGTITIDGGAGNETGGDTLQLGTLTNLTQAVKDTFVDDGSGSFSGSITLDDGTILNFSEIENIICFTPHTRIATPHGLTAVEDLEVGDLVVTRDHGLQPIRWIEGRTVPAIDRFAPVTIRKNVLPGMERDLIVSPQHRVLFQGYRAELLFGESEVLVAATHLVDGIDVTQDETHEVTYVHFMFDQHEIVFAEGAATESFHPGDIGFSAVGDAAREELFAIFPELRVDPRSYGTTARRCLKKHEAQLIRL